MKDAGQKDLLYRHFRAMGWHAMPEVPVFSRGGLHEKQKIITDVDVLGLRPSPDLKWELVIGDCKTKKGESPANRALWVRALMERLSAARGYLLLRRDKERIEPDHKLLADDLGIILLDERDFNSYDKAMVYPGGSSHIPETATQIKAFFLDVKSRFPGLSGFSDYISSWSWGESDRLTMMRRLIGEGRAIRGEIDPSKPEHISLVFEGAGVFAVGLAACVGRVFNQYLHPEDRNALDTALKYIIWGGRERYESNKAFRRELLEAKGAPAEDEQWALPKWPLFAHLVRTSLDCPRLAFRLPQLFRTIATDTLAPRPSRHVGDAMLLKLGLLCATYFSQACRFPQATTDLAQSMFTSRITEAVSRGSQPPAVANPASLHESQTESTDEAYTNVRTDEG